MSTYATRVFPSDVTKAAARRTSEAIAAVARADGIRPDRVTSTSRGGRPCVLVRTDHAWQHRVLVEWVTSRVERIAVRESNQAGGRALRVDR